MAEDASIAYLDQFAQLDGSVPDLAATLTTQAEQDAEDANLSFLRGELPEDDEEPMLERYEENSRRRRRAVDAMLGGRRYTSESLRELDELDDHAAADRNNPQDYHGWAPAVSDDEDETSTFETRQPTFRLVDHHALRRAESQDLRERMRNRLRRDQLEAQLDERSNSRRNLHLDYVEGETEHRTRSLINGAVTQGPTSESSLRTTALLQAVRRNTQLSAHPRHQMQRYIPDRERNGVEIEEARRATSTRPAPVSVLSPSQRRQINRETSGLPETERQRMQSEYQHQLMLLDQQALQTAYQRQEPYRGHDSSRLERRTARYWTQQPELGSKKNARSVDNVIKYLERLRLCESDEEGRITAEEGGFASDDRIRGDFLIDTSIIPSPPRSSWLEIGGVLSGTQNAVAPSRESNSSSSSSALPSYYVPLMPPSQYRSRIRHPTFGTTNARTTSPVPRDSPRPQITTSPPVDVESPLQINQNDRNWINSPADERWPVKVTIHGINYENMTLSGTMEAFNVPDKSSPTRESSITTFLEGEIIDFNKHTLETKSYKADARTDAIYWRKLPPFCHLKDDDTMTKNLLSRQWLREELMEKWILMRWKGTRPQPLLGLILNVLKLM